MESAMNGVGTEEKWPENVGILAMELCFPRFCVRQEELEEFDGVGKGKYTIGLGQEVMGFCTDREDIHSLCLTVTKNLLERFDIDLGQIGRLEVGTETIVDKSKSVKTMLMELFKDTGNHNLEGVDTVNACFGGTAALFNAINWIESSSWDGRMALVVMGDIAVYAEGPARCTGGAGAVALLIGPNAPLVFERGLRSFHSKHSYDFYKPQMESEYPVVDGKLSVQSYLSALDACFKLYADKASKIASDSFHLGQLDGMVFHSPYCKLVQKSLARLCFLDFLRGSRQSDSVDPTVLEVLENSRKVKLEDTYFDRDLEKAYMTYSKKAFERLTLPSLQFAKLIGNMYTPSLYGCLASFLLSKSGTDLLGNRIGLFSFGSGFMSSMFSIRISSQPNEQLERILAGLRSSQCLLKERTTLSPKQFTETLCVREEVMKSAPYEPKTDVDSSVFPGTFYLANIDEKYRRTYQRTASTGEPFLNGTAKP